MTSGADLGINAEPEKGVVDAGSNGAVGSADLLFAQAIVSQSIARRLGPGQLNQDGRGGTRTPTSAL